MLIFTLFMIVLLSTIMVINIRDGSITDKIKKEANKRLVQTNSTKNVTKKTGNSTAPETP